MQEIIVFLIVALAVAYITWQTWLSLRGKKSCCESGCGKASTHKKNELVQISLNGKTLPVQPNHNDSKSSLN